MIREINRKTIFMRYKYMRLIFFSGVIYFFMSNSVLAKSFENINSMVKELKNLDIPELGINFQTALEKPIEVRDIGYGVAPVYLYALPKEERNYQILISSIVKEGQLFYPVVLLLNSNFDVILEVQEPAMVKIDASGRAVFDVVVPVASEHDYVLITSDTQLYGKSSGIIGGGSFDRVIFSAEPQIELFMPGSRRIDSDPLIRKLYQPHKGFYIGFGANFGGDRVAVNPGGDNYKPGSGGIFFVGYGGLLFKLDHWAWRASVGWRCHGCVDKGENPENERGGSEAMIMQSSLFYSMVRWNIGAGLYSDLNNSLEDNDGNIIDFKDSVGAQVYLEYRLLNSFAFGVRYLDIDYETDRGETFKGVNSSIYVNIWF